MSFFWFQRTGGEEAWQNALSDHRSKILAEIRPAFVTVLDASAVPESDWSREQYDQVKYSGPFYIDWDAASIEEAVEGFHVALAKLGEMEVDLHSLRLYATGGRGFHLEMPEQIFMPKIAKGGVSHLPGIYREMAMELLTESMDMRVYTGRRGRMWRVPGVKRDNGKYKVPLTVEQALAMTPELYDELCSEPRVEPERTTPTTNMAMAALYVKSVEKIAKAIKNRGKTAKDKELLAQFKGEWPTSIKRIMTGEGLSKGVGWNRIAMQLAITANALGKSADDLIAGCEKLIKEHVGDGRYNSPRKRRESLRDMWHYTNESDAYSYSRGGIRSIVTPDFPTGDLDGANANIGVGNVPEELDDAEDADASSDETKEEIANAASTLLEGMSIQKSGVYKRTSDGWKMVSNVSFIKPSITVDTEDGLTLGIEADIVSDGKKFGRHLVPAKAFHSRANLSSFCSGRNGIFSGTDSQASVVGLMLQRNAVKGNRMIYVVRREGLDLVQNPLDRSKVDLEAIWVSPDHVLTHRQDVQFKYQPKLGASNLFNTDIGLCAPLQNTEDSKAWLHSLLNVNSATIVAQMLGWFVSCFHKQHYQRAFDQFPLLHPNGPAGSGKTLTTKLMARMFHNTSRVTSLSAGGGTLFPFRHAWSSSASIPLIIDEYKPHEMRQDRVEFLLQSFRLAYNQEFASSGGVNRGGADSSFRDITEYSYSAPTVFLSESQEGQTAVQQRCVPLSFSPEDSKARTVHFNLASAGANFMPQLGRLVLAMTLGAKDGDAWQVEPETVESRAAALRPLIDSLRSSLHPGVHDRQVYNLAVVLEGLNFLDRTLQVVFGTEFCPEIERLTQAVHDQKHDLQVSVMSEAAKVLNDMALISRTEPSDGEFALRESYEYCFTEQGDIEILMREAFVKYFAWTKRKGFPPLYTSPDAFITAMAKFPAVVDRLCLQSPLRKGAQSRILRFSLQKLAAEGVEGFKSKHVD